MKRSSWIILGVIALFVIWVVASYNGMISARQRVDTQWAQVENQFQRRFDLIPNLEASVKGIFKQEQTIFLALAEARKAYAGATTQEQRVTAANQVETGLGRLLVIVENYPQLKSSETVQTLMAQLEGTENRVAVERGRYNETVQYYNVKILRFPGNIMAGLFGFKEKLLFKAIEGADQAPKVNF